MSNHFTPQSTSRTPLHTAMILDGSGRWAELRYLPRCAGHSAGAQAVEAVVRAAPAFGLRRLSLFALSSDNLHRPAREVEALFKLVQRYLETHAAECRADGVRLALCGRRDRLPSSLLAAAHYAEAATADGG